MILFFTLTTINAIRLSFRFQAQTKETKGSRGVYPKN